MSCRQAIGSQQSAVNEGKRPVPADVFIFINGILTLPSDKNGWTDRAARWIDEELEWLCASGEALEYFTGPSLMWRTLMNQQMVRKLIRRTEQIPAGTRIHLIGHSNGCDIICSALPAIRANVRSITLIAAAVEHNFHFNHLNEALIDRPDLRVQVLCSPDDEVLKWLARPSRWILGKLGYGYLGYQAAVDSSALKVFIPSQIDVVSCPGFGHGDYFKPGYFDKTMQRVVFAAGLTGKERLL